MRECLRPARPGRLGEGRPECRRREQQHPDPFRLRPELGDAHQLLERRRLEIVGVVDQDDAGDAPVQEAGDVRVHAGPQALVIQAFLRGQVEGPGDGTEHARGGEVGAGGETRDPHALRQAPEQGVEEHGLADAGLAEHGDQRAPEAFRVRETREEALAAALGKDVDEDFREREGVALETERVKTAAVAVVHPALPGRARSRR